MTEELQRMIEQAIVEVPAEELGKRVFPGASNARMKVQTLTQRQGNGKPRSLKVGEFIALSKALELDPVRVLGKALDRFEETRI